MIERENPARFVETVGAVPETGPERVDSIVEQADRAHRAWAARSLAERLAALADGAGDLAAQVDELAVLLARESGKVVADCRGELAFAVTFLRWVVAHAPGVYGDREFDDEVGRLLLVRRPYGVVVAITPWNAPIILAMLKIAPALAAGNAVVVKPSPLAPLTIDRVVASLARWLPDGVLAAAHGGAALGDKLVAHPLVRKVAFTGGGATGAAVAASAGRALTPTVMELGGNDPAVFLDDADLSPEAMRRLVMASFATSGQVCMAAKRLYVPRRRLPDFVAAYRYAAAEILLLGDPLVPAVTVGPVVSAAARDRLIALPAGLDPVPLGRVASDADLDAGYFVRPALVVDPAPGHPLVTAEQFGPLVPVLPYDDEPAVLAAANAGDLGLAASVWSADEDRAFAFARKFEAGYTFVNTHNRTGMSLRAPFGGIKGSGWGREYGEEGLLEYVQTCAITAPAPFRPGGTGLPANAYPPA